MNSLFAQATAYLARREHGAHELKQKLIDKGHSEVDIMATLDKCQQLGLQSDERFTESRYRLRLSQGYGPLRIRQELQHLRIDGEIVEAIFAQAQTDWLIQAQKVLQKKYKSEIKNAAFIQKQKNFLLYRGFSMSIVSEAIKR